MREGIGEKWANGVYRRMGLEQHFFPIRKVERAMRESRAADPNGYQEANPCASLDENLARRDVVCSCHCTDPVGASSFHAAACRGDRQPGGVEREDALLAQFQKH